MAINNEELIEEFQRFTALSQRNESSQKRHGKRRNENGEDNHGKGYGSGQGGAKGQGGNQNKGAGQGYGQTNKSGMGRGVGRGKRGAQGSGAGQGSRQGQDELTQGGHGHGKGRGRGQKRVLATLEAHDGINQKELAALLSVRPQTLSESLVKLEQDKLIERKHPEADKRVTHVFLTEEGRDQAQEALEERKTNAEELFGALTDEERMQFKTILSKLNTKLTEEVPSDELD